MTAPLRFPTAEVFIETGYGHGETLADIVKLPYRKIHSIEVNPALALAGQRRFATDDRVHVHCDSSVRRLPSLCEPNAATVFWLDAHASQGIYAGDDRDEQDPVAGSCPLLQELKIIAGVSWRVLPIIFIDEAPLILRKPWALYGVYDGTDYPTLSQIQEVLGARYRVTVHRQWQPCRAWSNLRYLGRKRYLRGRPMRT